MAFVKRSGCPPNNLACWQYRSQQSLAVLHVDHYQNREHEGCLQEDYQVCEGKLTGRWKELLYFLNVNYASASRYRWGFLWIGKFAGSETSKLIRISIKACSSLLQANASSFEEILCESKTLKPPKSLQLGQLARRIHTLLQHRQPLCFSWHSGSGRSLKSAQGYNQ